jgi:pimeloyl-ACP methyl ester carboxylesterase
MFENYRKKAVFGRISDAALQAYCQALACPQPDGSVKLCYPAEWEARIYVTSVRADMELWRGLPSLQPRLLVIRGAETDTFRESTGKLLRRKLPSAIVSTISDTTHLVALEQPETVARIMLDFLQDL